MSRYIDLTGQKFGMLTAKKYIGNDKNSHALWMFVCDCGNEHITLAQSAKLGLTSSCGCYKRKQNIKRATKHGMVGTRLYGLWKSMKTRCYIKSHKGYKEYGGRGIKVCEEWHNFKNFYKWASLNGYKDNLSIDRIDNNKGYEPSNCRWITLKQQQYNKRNNHYLTFCGITKTLTEWANEYNLQPKTIESRLKRGWQTEKAITTPVATKTIICS